METKEIKVEKGNQDERTPEEREALANEQAEKLCGAILNKKTVIFGTAIRNEEKDGIQVEMFCAGTNADMKRFALSLLKSLDKSDQFAIFLELTGDFL